MITKTDFLTAFKAKLGVFALLDDAIACAGVWWDIRAAVDVNLPYLLNPSWMRLNRKQLEHFRGRIDGDVLDRVMATTVVESCEYWKAFRDAAIEIGLYRWEWYFVNADDEDNEQCIGSEGDDEFDWYMAELQKSVDAAKDLGMTVTQYNVYHIDPKKLSQYHKARGDVSSPETGADGFDPILALHKACTRTNKEKDYERTDFVRVSESEINEQFEKIIKGELGVDVFEKLRRAAIKKAIAGKIENNHRKLAESTEQ